MDEPHPSDAKTHPPHDSAFARAVMRRVNGTPSPQPTTLPRRAIVALAVAAAVTVMLLGGAEACLAIAQNLGGTWMLMVSGALLLLAICFSLRRSS